VAPRLTIKYTFARKSLSTEDLKSYLGFSKARAKFILSHLSAKYCKPSPRCSEIAGVGASRGRKMPALNTGQ
jgi:hypothetical protein